MGRSIAIIVAGALISAPVCLLMPTGAVGQSQLPPCSRTLPTNAWDSCEGNRTYGSGNRYVGEYRNGQRNGLGTYRFANGDKYVGEFKDDQPNGRGTFTLANGSKYVGEFKDGYQDGNGTYTYADGSRYVGKFEDGKRNGQGTLTFADGSKYVGEFKNNQASGRGTLTLANGEKYVGKFEDGKPNGQCTFTSTSGVKYVGGYKDGKMEGQGIYTFTNGNKYDGEFKNGNPNGQGTYTYADGSKYVGGFKDGKRDGKGTFFNADGSMNEFSRFYADGWLDQVRPGADQEMIRMEKRGGVYVVPVRFNDVITLDAVVDSGASDLSIPADIVSTLMRTKTVTDEDFLGKQTYVLADGSEVPSQQFRIRSLKVGNKTLENVVASIASVNATILLGQSFLSKFKSWSVDNEKHTLVLR
jgi:hypothetical protein